jgi:hypothetical protein
VKSECRRAGEKRDEPKEIAKLIKRYDKDTLNLWRRIFNIMGKKIYTETQRKKKSKLEMFGSGLPSSLFMKEMTADGE